MASLQQNWASMKHKSYFPDVGREKGGILIKERVVLVRSNRGLGFDGGGGGGKDNGNDNKRLLVNLALVIGLTYLAMTDKLNWIPIGLMAIAVPFVGVGALIWWANREMIQSSCPNCGQEFKIFGSTRSDEVPMCPFCTQPFSVVDGKFVKEPIKFVNKTRIFDGVVNGFPYNSRKGDDSSLVVDVEAEINDVD